MTTKQAALDPEEVHRVNRARLAFLLHKLPSEIDAASFLEIVDLLEVQRGERLHAELEQAKRGR